MDSQMRLQHPKVSAGIPAYEYLRALTDQNSLIQSLSIIQYQHPAPLQERVHLSACDQERLEHAMALRSSTGMPFWDAVMLSCFGGSTSEAVLRSALFHQAVRKTRILVAREQILICALAEIASTNLVAIGSDVSLDQGQGGHLPLLDFHCPESSANDGVVLSVCRILFGCEVAIFRSGKSYHAYGLTILTQTELDQLLYRALLFAPIIDRAYVAHQLIEGGCALRLNCTVDKPIEPEFKFHLQPFS
jgi:hypothetical protein